MMGDDIDKRVKEINEEIVQLKNDIYELDLLIIALTAHM